MAQFTIRFVADGRFTRQRVALLFLLEPIVTQPVANIDSVWDLWMYVFSQRRIHWSVVYHMQENWVEF